MTKLKVLVLDIEISPIIAQVWGLRDQNIALNQIQQDWAVIAWAAKWLGEPEKATKYLDQRTAKDITDDRGILIPLWKLLDQADIVVTQNGKNFDSKKLNARFIEHGMNPPSPYRHLDTYQIVRQVAAFTSNKLEYLTEKLCKKYKKLTHKKFPGMTLWTECLKGNKDAWNEMRTYNIHDVLATEEFYLKIRAWAPAAMPDPFLVIDPAIECGKCSSAHVTRRGVAITKRGRYARLQCQACGSWAMGGKVKS